MNTYCKLSLILLVFLATSSCNNNGEPIGVESRPVTTDLRGAMRGPGPAAKRGCWNFGFSLGLALVMHAIDSPYEQYWEMAQGFAELYDVELLPLPAKTGNRSKDMALALAYITRGGVPQIVEILDTHMGEELASIFALGIKATAFFLTYYPADPAREQWASVLAESAQRARIPETLWRNTFNLIASGASEEAVNRSILEMNREIDEYYFRQISQ